MNGFKDRWLAPQIITSLSSVLRPHLHATWETFQQVIHHKIAPQQARLIVEFLRVGFLKKKGAHLVIEVVILILLSHTQSVTITPLEVHNVLIAPH